MPEMTSFSVATSQDGATIIAGNAAGLAELRARIDRALQHGQYDEARFVIARVEPFTTEAVTKLALEVQGRVS